MKHFILLVFSFLFGTYAIAQTELSSVENINSETEQNIEEQIRIISHNDLLDSLMNVHILCNNKNKLRGYRILVYSKGGLEGREGMFDTRAKFVVDFPELKTYVIYEKLEWKLKVGNYRNKQEAYKDWVAIKNKYRKLDKEVIMVPSEIEYPQFD